LLGELWFSLLVSLLSDGGMSIGCEVVPGNPDLNCDDSMAACSYVPIFDPSSGVGMTEDSLRFKKSSASNMIRQMDFDGDGLISREEFRAILTDSPEMDSLTNYDMRLMPVVDEEMQAAVRV
jgi:hypothetical protein